MTNHQDFSKIMKTILLIIVLFSISTFNIYAQYLDIANYHFERTSYKEATRYYLKVKNKSKDVLKALGDCYYYTSDTKNAKKWYKRLIDRYGEEVSIDYYFKYSQVLYSNNEIANANKWLEKYKIATKINTIDSLTIASNYKSLLLEDRNLSFSRLDSNTKSSEFGGSFYNNKLVFTATAKSGETYSWTRENYLDIFIADIDNNGCLYNITPLPGKINSKWHDSNGVITKDGNTLYFTSNNRYGNKKIMGKDKIGYLKIYKAKKVNNTWQDIEELPFNVDNYITEHPALNEDETKLYFASDRPGSIGSLDIYVVDIYPDGTYGKPTNLGTKINTEKREQFPFVNNDTLYFASNGHLGLGGLDIFSSKIKSTGYTEPQNLKKGINSTLDDFAYTKSNSLNIGYFSSNRNGNDDIFLFKKKPLPNLITIQLRDNKTNEIINQDAFLKLYIDNKLITDSPVTSDSTSFAVKFDPKKQYKIKGQHKLYAPSQIIISRNDILKGRPLILSLNKYTEVEELIIEKNNKTQIKHEPIYFDLNSSYLRADTKPILDKIVNVLNKYPEINIRCESHTDSRAPKEYNIWLSNRRAKRTADYIISKGIDSSRVTMAGFGESQLLNKCGDNTKCTEEEHQYNRRTEFVLISKQEIYKH